MKTRKGSSRAEKPSNDEEDASSDENVKLTSKKSAKKSAKRKNVKLPLMELTKNDSAPRWLSKCPRDEAGRFLVEAAWVAAIESAHGQGYGDINASHRGINHTLQLAERYFKSMGWAIPNDARTSVTEFIGRCITCQKSRAKLDKTTLK